MSATEPPPEPEPRRDISKVIELGDDRRFSFVADVDGETIGIIFDHPAKETKGGPVRCRGSVFFDVPAARKLVPERVRWNVVRLDPLSLTPSIQCTACGEHGWIRYGKWVNA